jgi:hypothetical protein
MKGLFERNLGLTFANKETMLELNGCTIEAYLSNHIDAYRAEFCTVSLPDCVIMYIESLTHIVSVEELYFSFFF